MIGRVQIISPRRIRPDLVAIVCARDIEIDMAGAGGVSRLYRDITLNGQILFDSRRRSGSVITTGQGSYKNLITTSQNKHASKKNPPQQNLKKGWKKTKGKQAQHTYSNPSDLLNIPPKPLEITPIFRHVDPTGNLLIIMSKLNSNINGVVSNLCFGFFNHFCPITSFTEGFCRGAVVSVVVARGALPESVV